ncbi:extracellular solute-binding protein [Demequina sp. SYSU T00192]|uniref:Extracellular solute-binding protein n=1 Tax=Demequina litoralis TaxID=3051660 RepID=A0ABT8G6K5_9MICO|nr:extracellular solute-binding protein [Demequina sp. SYSU T00192]MDN4474779.1 extracellular solute-binding protein [Demequina sp. SYSU T00192]
MNRTIVPVVVSASVLALAACSTAADPGAGESSGGTTDLAASITQLDGYTDGTSAEAWQSMLDECSDETGVAIERQSLPTSQMMPTILRQASSRSMANLIFVDNPNVQQIAATGALAPLDSLGLSADGYPDGIAAAGSYDGSLYGLAPGVNALALFYNKDILADAGVEPPTTWDELRAAAAELTTGNTYGLSMALLPTEEGTWQFLPFFWGAGAELTDVGSDEAVEALTFVQGLFDDGSVSASALNWNQAEAGDQFTAGQAAMTITGSWSVANFDKAASVDYGIVPIPAADGSAAPVALGGEVGVISQADDAEMAAAAAVLECMTSPEHQTYWAEQHAYIPGQTAVAEEYGAATPTMQAFVDAVASARPRTDDLGEAYPTTSTALIEAVQNALTGQLSPADALNAAASSVSSGQ